MMRLQSWHVVAIEVQEKSIQVHYVIDVEVNENKNLDFAGKFHITTTWNRRFDKWMVVFNMDKRNQT